jgi:hypothetical protein
MEDDTSTEQHSSGNQPVTVADVTRTPAGLRVETDEGTEYTFRRDLDAYERGENVWVPDLPTPSEIVAILNHEGYNVRTTGDSE